MAPKKIITRLLPLPVYFGLCQSHWTSYFGSLVFCRPINFYTTPNFDQHIHQRKTISYQYCPKYSLQFISLMLPHSRLCRRNTIKCWSVMLFVFSFLLFEYSAERAQKNKEQGALHATTLRGTRCMSLFCVFELRCWLRQVNLDRQGIKG